MADDVAFFKELEMHRVVTWVPKSDVSVRLYANVVKWRHIYNEVQAHVLSDSTIEGMGMKRVLRLPPPRGTMTFMAAEARKLRRPLAAGMYEDAIALLDEMQANRYIAGHADTPMDESYQAAALAYACQGLAGALSDHADYLRLK